MSNSVKIFTPLSLNTYLKCAFLCYMFFWTKYIHYMSNCVRCHFTCLQIPQNICHLTWMCQRSNLALTCAMQLLLNANEAVFCPTDREKSHRSPSAWLSSLTGCTMIYSLLNEVSCTVYIKGMTLLNCERKGEAIAGQR